MKFDDEVRYHNQVILQDGDLIAIRKNLVGDFKFFRVEGSDIVDGYHSFAELYDHRIALFCLLIRANVFFSKTCVFDHYEGWDMVRCRTNKDEQISYHIPKDKRHLWHDETFLEGAADSWDGHNSNDVVIRLNNANIKS